MVAVSGFTVPARASGVPIEAVEGTPVMLVTGMNAVTVKVKVNVASGDIPLPAVRTTGYVPAGSPAAMSNVLAALFHVMAESPLVFVTATEAGPEMVYAPVDAAA